MVTRVQGIPRDNQVRTRKDLHFRQSNLSNLSVSEVVQRLIDHIPSNMLTITLTVEKIRLVWKSVMGIEV